MRIIDADSLLESISTMPDLKINGVTIAVAVAKCVTIDAVPVVRCFDCGHGMRCVDGYVRCSHPSGKSILMKSSDFCSYGERKEGAE